MTMTKTYTCDLCKAEAKKKELFVITIIGYGAPIREKHAHKECLIKTGLLPEHVPLLPERDEEDDNE